MVVLPTGSNAVINRLRDFIAAERLLPGDRLLSERELAERLGVPRTALRRMLSELAAAGAIVREVGRGTFIADAGEASFAPPPARSTGRRTPAPAERATRTHPAEVFETRLIIEPKAAFLAAQRAAPEDVREMRAAIKRGRSARSLAEFERWDAAFHGLVVRSTRNQLLMSLYEEIGAVRAGAVWGRLKEQSLTEERMARYLDSHEAMVAAFEDRDHARAESEMARHIAEARANMLQPENFLL